MKAIVTNVHKESPYRKHIGLTYTISFLSHNGVDLNINSVDTFFTFKEINIVDIQNEILKISNPLSMLDVYLETNNITII